MNSPVSQVVALLERSEVMGRLSQPPDVALIPFMGNRDSFYLLVSLVLNEASAPGASAIKVVEAATHAILRTHCLDELPGLEIVPCDLHNGRVRRLFRFSLQRRAFERALEPFAPDLLQEVPFEDATCGWYVAKPTSPPTPDSERSTPRG